MLFKTLRKHLGLLSTLNVITPNVMTIISNKMAYIISLFWRSAKTGDRQRGKRLHLVKIVKATPIKCNDAKHKLTDFSKEKKKKRMRQSIPYSKRVRGEEYGTRGQHKS